MPKTYHLTVTEDELTLLREALNSHEYWQLSDEFDRNNGYSLVKDGEDAEIDACRALLVKLECKFDR